MPQTLTPAEVQRYLRNDNCVAVATVHGQHVARIAEALARRHKGILFLWDEVAGAASCTLCAVQPNGRGVSPLAEEEIIAEAEQLAAELLEQDPPKPPSFLARMLAPVRQRSLGPGWRFEE